MFSFPTIDCVLGLLHGANIIGAELSDGKYAVVLTQLCFCIFFISHIAEYRL